MDDSSGSSGFRHLRVWQEAIQLAIAVRPVCAALRRRRQANLADQLVRAARSVHGNIAEGNGRTGRADRARVFTIAWSELLEVESFLTEASADPSLRDQLAPCFVRARHTARLLAALRRRFRE